MKVELNNDEVFILRQGLLNMINEANAFQEQLVVDANAERAVSDYVSKLRTLFNKLHE